jgi:hypothetical protein
MNNNRVNSEYIKITYSLSDEQVMLSVDPKNTIENLVNHIGNSHKFLPKEIEIFYNEKKLTIPDYRKTIREVVGDRKQPYFYIKTNGREAANHVTIEGFPSRPELYEQLHVFLRENGYNVNYRDENKDNWVKFSFYENVRKMN